MKLFLIVLLSVLSYHHCIGYPIVEGELSKDQLLENSTAIEYGFNASNETTSNDFSPMEMHGAGKKVVNKVKEGIKAVKDKVTGGFNKVKDKVKGGFDKVKDKINNFKDKIGSKGGGSGGSYYRDKYDRDYDRDRYNRDYRRKNDYTGGGGGYDPNAKWIGLGIGVFMLVGIVGTMIFYLCKIERN